MADLVKFEFHEPGLHHVTQSWAGPTGRFVARKSEQLDSLSKLSAGFDTGQLFTALGVTYGHHEPSGDLESKVGANTHAIKPRIGYAYWHHEGTYPHEIRPRVAKALRFVKGGIVVYATRVWHPGTTPVKYLTRWLRDLF